MTNSAYKDAMDLFRRIMIGLDAAETLDDANDIETLALLEDTARNIIQEIEIRDHLASEWLLNEKELHNA